MTNFDDYLAELMKNPNFKKEYDALAPEFLTLLGKQPDAETLAAMEETEALIRDPDTKRYTVKEALKELNRED